MLLVKETSYFGSALYPPDMQWHTTYWKVQYVYIMSFEQMWVSLAKHSDPCGGVCFAILLDIITQGRTCQAFQKRRFMQLPILFMVNISTAFGTDRPCEAPLGSRVLRKLCSDPGSELLLNLRVITLHFCAASCLQEHHVVCIRYVQKVLLTHGWGERVHKECYIIRFRATYHSVIDLPVLINVAATRLGNHVLHL